MQPKVIFDNNSVILKVNYKTFIFESVSELLSHLRKHGIEIAIGDCIVK